MSIIRTPARKPKGDNDLHHHSPPLVSSSGPPSGPFSTGPGWPGTSSPGHSSTGSRAGRWTTPTTSVPPSATICTAAWSAAPRPNRPRVSSARILSASFASGSIAMLESTSKPAYSRERHAARMTFGAGPSWPVVFRFLPSTVVLKRVWTLVPPGKSGPSVLATFLRPGKQDY